MTVEAERRRHRATSFGAAVDAYERGRPTYPNATVDWLLGSHGRRVLDLGAGTGKLTRALVARGCDTVAVDPSPEMLARLRDQVPEVDSRVGTAESIPLPDGCIDAVVVGQAWHWVDPRKAVPEIARVLRPHGTLGIVWNVRDAAVDWVARLDRIVDGGKPDPTFTGTPIIGRPFGAIDAHETRWRYVLDLGGLIALAASRSKTIVMPPVERAALEADLHALFDDVADDGLMAIPYITYAFRATRS